MTNEGTPRPFHERFDIEIGADEAKRRFLNRAYNNIFNYIEDVYFSEYHMGYDDEYYKILRDVADALGEQYASNIRLVVHVQDDFRRCLEVLEAAYQAVGDHNLADEVAERIDLLIRRSEVDLGIEWQPPIFVRTGARLLDEELVNDPLRWLAEPKYEPVRKPFEKGLSHYLEATNRPDRLTDVITDMYEAVEALAKIVTGRDKDLSGNREVFIKSLKVSDYYKRCSKTTLSMVVNFVMQNV